MADNTQQQAASPAIKPANIPQVPESTPQGFGQPINVAIPQGVNPELGSQQMQGQDFGQEQKRPYLLQPQDKPLDSQQAIALALQALMGQAQQPTAKVPETKQEPPEEIPEVSAAVQVEDINDPVVKSMVGVLQAFGDIDVSRAIAKALEYNDPSLVDAAYIKSVAGDKAQQALQVAKSLVSTISAKAAEVEQQVFALAGGQAQWDAAVTAFNQAAPRELKLAVANMLNTVNPDMVKAGAKLIVQFGQLSGAMPQVGTQNITAIPGSVSGNALSKAQFKLEVAKLDPQDPEYESKYTQLFQRRVAGKKLGLN